jgi:pSer/pThr/pTyr-binding forkhead associated (FHA) protein
MKLKNWMVGKVNRVGDPGPREPQAEVREPRMNAIVKQRGTVPQDVESLGPYRALIGAIREELEHFVTTQLRLHLAIAERDRYVLTSVEIECDESDEHRELLRRFIGEFKPEQIKHYLAKEVIAGLRNASAIDLSQFAGLNAAQREGGTNEQAEQYGELLAELRRGSPQSVARPYRVTLLGRWSQLDAAAPASDRASPRPRNAQTPLSPQALAIDIEDAAGVRHVELPSVVPGRRYVVGKGEDCDIVVDGAYASRRHCELWLDKGTWWVVDAGSTNGIRVESSDGVIARCHEGEQRSAPPPPIELAPGGRLILSARAEGEPRKYPRLSLRPVDATETPTKLRGAISPTPVTPIAPARRREGALTITVHMASGVRTVDIPGGALPFRVGRSRTQALIIDRAHAEVSGRHFEIVALDESGAQIVVHGDNGVVVDGTSHGPGTQFKWKPGETLLLGGGTGPTSACTLTLSRSA